MKRKTAIEECIEFTESSAHRETKARKELRALLLAADVLDRHDTGLEPEVDVALARLRRLGVLPEVRRD